MSHPFVVAVLVFPWGCVGGAQVGWGGWSVGGSGTVWLSVGVAGAVVGRGGVGGLTIPWAVPWRRLKHTATRKEHQQLAFKSKKSFPNHCALASFASIFRSFEAGIANAIFSFQWRKIVIFMKNGHIQYQYRIIVLPEPLLKLKSYFIKFSNISIYLKLA